MAKVQITLKIDEDLLRRIREIGLDPSDYLERAARTQFEKMQGGSIKPKND